MNTLRQILAIALLPLYLLIGSFLVGWVSRSFDLWHMYVAAIILPTIGLLGTYFVVSNYRLHNTVVIYVLGMTTAFLFGYPAQYPEGAANAYQWTYRPFALTFVWSSALLICLIILTKRKKTIASLTNEKSHES